MKKALLIFFAMFAITFAISAQTYVGPEKCLMCHNNPALHDMTGWRTSMHANGYSVQLDDTYSMQTLYGMVNDYDGNGIDDFKDGLNFNEISSAFDEFKPNAPILGYSDETGYTMTIGDVTHKVVMTYGGSGLYKQRYMMKVMTSEGYSASYYVSPVQFNEKTGEYVTYHASDWWDGNTPLYTSTSTLADIAGNSRNIAKNCSGCHSNGLEIWQDDNGEWRMKGAPVDDETAYEGYNNVFDIDGDGNLDQINTTCERCHGPGGDHAAAPSPDNIINPAEDLTPDQANNLCGMCHSRGKSKPNNTFGFPFHDDTLVGWEVGDLVEPIYTDGGGNWGDDMTSKSHHQQFYDLYESSKPTFQFHQVTCYECHDVHNEVKHHITEMIEEEDSNGDPLEIATENDNNTLCLACHATHGEFENITKEMVADYNNNVDAIAAIVTEHTHHAYNPDGTGESRCSKCHMPKAAKSAITYDIHSHTFEVVPPEKTKQFGMPNACAVSCHGKAGDPSGDFGIGITDADFTDWAGDNQQALATKLMDYYGPDGEWWQHTVEVEYENFDIPKEFKLSQNYPNPFNPTTSINFSVPQTEDVKVVVYDILGKVVDVLVDDEVPAGNYKIIWNATAYSSGVYIYTMTSQSYNASKKMILIK